MPGLGDARVHLVTRKLASLTGFGALSHFDLDVCGIDQVVARDTEPTRRDLFDRAAPERVVEPLDVLTAFAAVGAATEPVHGDGHGFVRLGGDRPVTHRTCVEPRDDR